MSDSYIGQKCTLSQTKKYTQNKSDKIVSFKERLHAPFGKNDFVVGLYVLSTYFRLAYNLSDIYIGKILLTFRTNCTISRTKKHAQINYALCEPCLLSLFTVDHILPDAYIEYIRLILRVFFGPT